MEYFIIAFSAFLASLLTFYSGFGLGTLLMPIIAIFFPLPLAIGLTAFVHLFHNLLKATFLCRAISWGIVWRFGITACLAAIPGAWLLQAISTLSPLFTYSFFFIRGELSILGIVIGLLLILFATLELSSIPAFKTNHLFFGGMLSGFFGGLSGNQGAFRSLFLLNQNLNKKGFIGTAAAISTGVDLVRLVIYLFSFQQLLITTDLLLLSITLFSALGGVCLGMALLQKVTFVLIQQIVVVFLYVLGILLISGLI